MDICDDDDIVATVTAMTTGHIFRITKIRETDPGLLFRWHCAKASLELEWNTSLVDDETVNANFYSISNWRASQILRILVLCIFAIDLSGTLEVVTYYEMNAQLANQTKQLAFHILGAASSLASRPPVWRQEPTWPIAAAAADSIRFNWLILFFFLPKLRENIC